MTKSITQARFNLFTIGTRDSRAYYLYEELTYWSDLDENVIGVVIQDRVDNDFSWILMVRDRLGRFRAVNGNVNMASKRRAEADLRLRIAEVSREADLIKLGIQGDETNSPIDLLTPIPGKRSKELHPTFSNLIKSPVYAPARAVLREIGPWLTVTDPHFVKEFQYHQFDQRLWLQLDRVF